MLATRRRTAFAFFAVSALLLSGCAVGPGPEIASPPASSADPKRPHLAEAPSDTGTAPADLTFEAGAELPEDWSVQWGDPFMADERYSVESADDGNGGWAYRDNETQCVIRFWQGTVSDMDPTAGDRAATDALLATILDVTPEDIQTYAVDDSIPELLGGSVDVRTVSGDTEEGLTWVDSVRAFTVLSAGLYVGVECPGGQDALDVYTTLAEDYLQFVVGPAF